MSVERVGGVEPETVTIDDGFVDAIVDVVTGWTGETGTDYMAVTVKDEAEAAPRTPGPQAPFPKDGGV